ncbi:MAG: NAD-dependent epimerase/dehydratase family protein, partial [Polyangiaceae bacterium]
MDWKGKHVLVTGGAGFIGSHVADAVLARGARVTVFDDFSTGFREFVPKSDRVGVVEADLLDAARVTSAMNGVDFVFH